MTGDRKDVLADLQNIVAAMQHKTVLVAGDIMLDRFVYGDVHRVSPESPVPVLTIGHENFMPGGAGNVLANLCGLGVKAHLLSVIGPDAEGEKLRALVAEKGADPSGLVVAADRRPTTVKTRFLAAHQQLLRTDYERVSDIDEKDESALLAQAEKFLQGCGAVVLSDYGKGTMTPSLIEALIKKAGKAGIPVLVDPKKTDYRIYRGADIVTPNRKELSEATGGMPTRTDGEVAAAARKLMKESGIGSVVATRSQDGMTIIQARGEPVHLRTEALEVFDVSGAGDTVAATLAAALASGADLIQAATIANAAGGIVVAKVGTAAIRHVELVAALNRRDVSLQARPGGRAVVSAAHQGMICDADEAAEYAQRWRARGLKVGFTNGCFDILHPGHVNYLNAARGRCDRLIIGLNADESVRRLKGPSRPVNAQDARAAVLAALGAVDMVVIFGNDAQEDDKPIRLIEKLHPDIFFKGGDYAEESLPEAPVVRSYGGTVQIMPLSEGHSTSETIRKMKGRVA
ncbi:MAG: D-glycero-beta-D-manno-heptose-7-phosphate kinase [Proteobacteria bacterium]|nr:D-glycero-beta-D-manno-heptose-7-phosphate kinase [Pseudomonadota bacterium]